MVVLGVSCGERHRLKLLWGGGAGGHFCCGLRVILFGKGHEASSSIVPGEAESCHAIE